VGKKDPRAEKGLPAKKEAPALEVRTEPTARTEPMEAAVVEAA
jgi:hypothetical protein